MIAPWLKKYFPGNHSHATSVRDHIGKALMNFVDSGFADPKFLSEFTSGSDQKFWACVSEALIAARLLNKQFGIRKTIGAGPDFLLMDGIRKVWIEVICPEPVNVPTDWLDPKPFGTVNFPHEAILLRWTSAIKAKAEILVGSVDKTSLGYLGSGVVDPEDVYVIAVNGCRLRSGPFPALIGISQFPFAAEAVFPIGPYQLRIDKETSKVIDHNHQHRPFVLNQNQSPVSTFTFLDPQFNSVSAIWALDFNGEAVIGNNEPSVVIHNPNAQNPLPTGFLPADCEYRAISKGNDLFLSKIRTAAKTGC